MKTASLVTKAGGEFDLDVVIHTDQPSRGAQCELRFDPALVEVTSVKEGSFFSNWAASHGATTIMLPDRPSPDNQNGQVSLIGMAILGGDEGGPTGVGTLLTYHLRAKEGARGKAAFSLENVEVADAGSSGIAQALPNVKRQNAILSIGQGTVPAQPGQSIDLGSGAHLSVLTADEKGAAFLLEWQRFRALLPLGEGKGLPEMGEVQALLIPKNAPEGEQSAAWINALKPRILLGEVPAELEGYSALSTSRYGWIESATDGEQMWVEGEKK
ncbi:MAG TPA: cohesin domain-containing protein [Anaerolineaceae bacterium]|nr:cohesin domain-containing protein [Anaerolineaceae bacterium]